mmetsp:Transcript_19692/g.37528  ORF Transcript_19692/g.37528 Transcript_19692/m.37528 type:complete len:213 (-) Transcript_19692:538-1176(-)
MTGTLQLLVVVQRNGVVQLKQMVALHFNCLLICAARVLKVIQLGQRDGQVHVTGGKVRLQVDGRAEKVKRACKLPSVEMDQAEVVANDPLKGIQVQGLLQASDGRDVPLLSEEAHAYVVPHLRRVGRLHRGDAVLDERHVHVRVVLDDAAGGQDGLGVLGVVRQRVAQKIERAVVLAHPQVQQAYGGQDLWVLGGEFQSLQVQLDGHLVVFL